MRRQPTAQQSTRSAQRLFEFRGFWLGREDGTDYIFYYWYDKEKRRTRRATTGQRELEKAKEYLIELALAHPPDEPLHPKNVSLRSVEKFYFLHHADKIRSKNAAKRAFKLVLQYLRQTVERDGDLMAADFGVARQEGFMKWAHAKYSLSGKTIATYLSTIKAALRFCAKERLVRDATGRERIARLLEAAPFINDNEAEVCKITKLPRSQPRKDIPEDAGMASFIDAIGDDEEFEHIFRFVIMELNTWARPEAVTDLSVKNQVRFERGLVDMNPPGRVQNKKFRPLIRLTDNLRGWLIYWDRDRPLFRPGLPNVPIKGVDNRTLAKIAKRAGLTTKVTRYTFRHYMATRIRNVQGISIDREERGEWLGHKAQTFKVMQDFYESFDADYLTNAMRGTDAILSRLNTLCRRPLFAPGAVQGTGLVVVSGGQPVGKGAKRDASDVG